MNDSIDILLAEANMDDAELTIRALRSNNASINILHVKNSQEALDYLFNPANALPKMVLLDVKNGIQVLMKLKSNDAKKIIPVVMLTASEEENDLIESYRLSVNAFIVKPVTYDNLENVLRKLGIFWVLAKQQNKTVHGSN